MATANELDLGKGDMVVYIAVQKKVPGAIIRGIPPCYPGARTEIVICRVLDIDVPHEAKSFEPGTELEILGSNCQDMGTRLTSRLTRSFTGLLRAEPIEEIQDGFRLRGDQRLMQSLEAAGLETKIQNVNGVVKFITDAQPNLF